MKVPVIDHVRTEDIRKRAREIAKDKDARQKALKLLRSRANHEIRIGANILLRDVGVTDKQLEDAIRFLSTHADWELREEAAMMFRTLIKRNFDHWFNVMKDFVNSDSVNLKRAAVVGAMTKLSKEQTKKIVEAIFQPNLPYNHVYMKKNLGPFAIGSHLLKNEPVLTFSYLNKWIKNKNENVRWNVLMAFSQAQGKKYREQALKYVRQVEQDPSKTVQRAVKAIKRRFS